MYVDLYSSRFPIDSWQLGMKQVYTLQYRATGYLLFTVNINTILYYIFSHSHISTMRCVCSLCQR
jgi:hypothetical protein